MFHLARLIAAAFLASACAPAVVKPTVAPVKAEISKPVEQPLNIDGNQRLGKEVEPLRYDLKLTVDPSKDRFQGEVKIEIRLAVAADLIRLQARGLEISTAFAVAGGEKIPCKVVSGENHGIGLKPEKPISAGLAELHFEYSAPLREVPLFGLYRVKAGDAWYAYTQFEATAARRAFPCFDQPEFKTPFSVRVQVPKGLIAVGNAPETGRRVVGEYEEISFAETEPLPTYLVALAVGPFDVIETEGGRGKKRIRAFTTKGKGELAEYLLEATPGILEALESYFDMPYPFAKLDIVAVPNFDAGAMENAGLVTFKDGRMLIDRKRTPEAEKMRAKVTMAHELAHMWLGNLVTMEWWDDLWLNEGLATWAEIGVMKKVAPGYEKELLAGIDARDAMSLDAQAEARAVRQPIRNGGDISNAFDSITYDKGCAVIRMIESWVGRDGLMKGVRGYLGNNAYKTVSTERLFDELNAATGMRIDEIADRFLNQSGTPLVEITPKCDGSGTSLDLKQSRYLPEGSVSAQGEPWTVPICVRYADGKAEARRQCFLLDGKSKTVALESKDCPAWIYPNADERGYFRWLLPDDYLDALVFKHIDALTLEERISLPNHLAALFEAGRLSTARYIEALDKLAGEEHWLIADGVIDDLYQIYRTAIDGDTQAKFARFVRKLLGPHLKRIGTKSKSKDDFGTQYLRPKLLGAMAEMGRYEKLTKEAKRYVDKLLSKPESVDMSMAGTWLGMAAWNGGPELWERLRAAVASAATPTLRTDLISALGSFRNPELLKKSLNLVLDKTLMSDDFFRLSRSIGDTPVSQRALWEWIEANADRLPEVFGDTVWSDLPWKASGFCGESEKAAVQRFFASPDRSTAATERNVSLVSEAIDRCARLKAKLVRDLAACLN